MPVTACPWPRRSSMSELTPPGLQRIAGLLPWRRRRSAHLTSGSADRARCKIFRLASARPARCAKLAAGYDAHDPEPPASAPCRLFFLTSSQGSNANHHCNPDFGGQPQGGGNEADIALRVCALLLAGASARREHAHAEPVVDDRSCGHDTRSTASSPTATRSTPATRLDLAASSSAPRRRSTPSTSPSCGAPTSDRPAPQVGRARVATSTTTRSSPSARTCRRPNTRVVTFEMCGNDGLQARSSFAGQTGTCNYTPLNTRAQQLHELLAAGDGLHQRQRLLRAPS